MIEAWITAREQAFAAVAAGADSSAAEAFRVMAKIETDASSEGCATKRLLLALAVAEADADGEPLGPAWDIVRAVAKELSIRR